MTGVYKRKSRQRVSWPEATSHRWRQTIAHITAASELGPLWLQCHGIDDPIKFTKLLTVDHANAMGVTRWAPALVTDDLSAREMAIFLGLARGETLSDISARIYVVVKTASAFRSRILEKTGLRNNVEIAVYADRNGLVNIGRLPQPVADRPPSSPLVKAFVPAVPQAAGVSGDA